MMLLPRAAFAALLAAAPVAAQNMVTNGDFESGLAGWGFFGNVFAETANPPAIVPRSGSQLCKMYGQFSGAFNVSGIYQSFPASPGQNFTLDCWSRHFDGDSLTGAGAPNDNWVVMKIAFFDGGGTEIGGAEATILDGTFPTNTWIDNAPVSGIAPAGTASVQALVLFLQPGFASGAAQIDDLSFTGSSSGAQTIEITSAPAYGNPGSITGTVSGVNFATHRVAVYIHIDGAGWFTKPSAATPTVPISPNGTFSANVYTCCLDAGATIYCAALLAPGVTPPPAAGACAAPIGTQALAIDHFERFGRTVQFAGRKWAVKESTLPVGPGGNLFSDDPNDVFVDAGGRLHLRVVQRGGAWRSSEVVLLDDVGYGTYWFTTESEVGHLDPNLTFGAFTWDSYCDDLTIPTWPNREIDFEDSRWGNPSSPTTSQVVVQPYSVSGNMVRYRTPTLGPTPTLSRFFTWTPTRIDFGAVIGKVSPCSTNGANVLHASTYLHNPSIGRRIPPQGREKFRFNLWINSGSAPRNGQPSEVIISDFRFAPAGVFPAGCNINPAGSATIVSGTPKLGTTITLGIDNPLGSQRPGSRAALIVGAAPSSSFPCGFLLAGFGMTGSFGELLVGLGAPHVTVSGGAWSGAGAPVPISLTVPSIPSLVGLPLYTQGVLIDPGGPIPIGLADAFELCIRP